MLPALLTTFLWSCSAICAARSAQMVGGAVANFIRMAVAAVLLGAWAHTLGQGMGGPALPWFIASGVIGFGFGDLAMFSSLHRIGPRLTMLLTHCLAALIATAVAWAWFGDSLGWSDILCAFVILGGVVLALAPDHGSRVPCRTFWIGVLFGIGSALGQGIGAVLSRKAFFAAEEIGVSVDGGTAAYERIVPGLLVGLAFMIYMRRKKPEPSAAPGVWPRAWLWMIANALAGPSVGVACFQWGVATMKPGILMPIVATVPVVTQFIAWVVNGQRPTARTIIGGIIAVAGVTALFLLREGK